MRREKATKLIDEVLELCSSLVPEFHHAHRNPHMVKQGDTKPESTEGGRRVSVLKRQEGAPVNLG